MIILGNSTFSVSIAKKLVRNVKGFLLLDNEVPLIISDQGISIYEYKHSDSFILGELSHVSRTRYLDFIKQFVHVNRDTFPNIIGKDVDTSSMASIGCGNIILNKVDIFPDCMLGDFNYIGVSSTINSKTEIGSNNIIREHVTIGYNCIIKNNNILESKAIITDGINIGNYNIVSHGECVFDDILNQELFQSGIVQKIR